MKNSIIVVKLEKDCKFIDLDVFTVLTKAIDESKPPDNYQKIAEQLRKNGVYIDDKSSNTYDFMYIEKKPQKGYYRKSAKGKNAH